MWIEALNDAIELIYGQAPSSAYDRLEQFGILLVIVHFGIDSLIVGQQGFHANVIKLYSYACYGFRSWFFGDLCSHRLASRLKKALIFGYQPALEL
jgi:hypothetical protein